MVPGVLALAVTSAAFTGLAIGTGFERKYGVLKRLGATALPRSVLLLGKTGAVLVRRAAAGAAGRRAGAGARLAADRRRAAALSTLALVRGRHGRLRRARRC